MSDAIGFEVGEKVWVTHAGQEQVQRPCIVCFGVRVVRVELGDGEIIVCPCEMCGPGGRDATGYLNEYEWTAGAELRTVTRREAREEAGKAPDVTYNFGNRYVYACDVFATEDEAKARCAEKVKEYEAEQLRRRTWGKERAAKSYSWHVGYHRREAKRARQQLEYHEGKIPAMKAKAKTPVGEEPQS